MRHFSDDRWVCTHIFPGSGGRAGGAGTRSPAGCRKIFSEQVSSVAERQQLESALDYVREGDIFSVTKLDRLARSVGDLLAIVARLD
jgi:hypothetical protein